VSSRFLNFKFGCVPRVIGVQSAVSFPKGQMARVRFQWHFSGKANQMYFRYTSPVIPQISHRVERFAEPTPCMTYRGFNYLVSVDGKDFYVRHYDDLAGAAIVVNPELARQMPQVRSLVNYLLLNLEFEQVFFYDARTDEYREVDVQTLEFMAEETRRSEAIPSFNGNRKPSRTAPVAAGAAQDISDSFSSGLSPA
jgi:hypothetical protein